MSLARTIIGTLRGIPRALALAEAELDELYAVADALQDGSNAVLGVALDVIALKEGCRIMADRHGARPRPQNGEPEL